MQKRVASIYAALQNGDPHTAVRAATAALKKEKQSHSILLLQALKAVGLQSSSNSTAQALEVTAIGLVPDCRPPLFGLEREASASALCLLCQQLCRQVLQQKPVDPEVLHLCTLVLKAHGRLSEVTAAYTAASAATPQDLDLLKAVFWCHVRSGEVCWLTGRSRKTYFLTVGAGPWALARAGSMTL